MSKLGERIQKHFAGLPACIIEVQEWADDDGNPAVFHLPMFSLAMKDQLQKDGKARGQRAAFVKTLVEHAKTADGGRAFDNDDALVLRNHGSSEILEKIFEDWSLSAGDEIVEFPDNEAGE